MLRVQTCNWLRWLERRMLIQNVTLKYISRYPNVCASKEQKMPSTVTEDKQVHIVIKPSWGSKLPSWGCSTRSVQLSALESSRTCASRSHIFAGTARSSSAGCSGGSGPWSAPARAEIWRPRAPSCRYLENIFCRHLVPRSRRRTFRSQDGEHLAGLHRQAHVFQDHPGFDVAEDALQTRTRFNLSGKEILTALRLSWKCVIVFRIEIKLFVMTVLSWQLMINFLIEYRRLLVYIVRLRRPEFDSRERRNFLKVCSSSRISYSYGTRHTVKV